MPPVIFAASSHWIVFGWEKTHWAELAGERMVVGWDAEVFGTVAVGCAPLTAPGFVPVAVEVSEVVVPGTSGCFSGAGEDPFIKSQMPPTATTTTATIMPRYFLLVIGSV